MAYFRPVGRSVAFNSECIETPALIGQSTRTIPRLLIALTLVALTLRLWGITFGLPHTEARPDEDVIVDTAVHMWSDGLNPHRFDWPTLYMYAMTAAFGAYFAVSRLTGHFGDLGFAMFANTHSVQLYLIDRVAVALLGTATVPLLFYSARRLFTANDEQDAFFAPLSGFGRLLRPGPTIEIFERTGR